MLARLQEQPELMAMLNSSLAQITAEATDSSLQDLIYSDLTTILKQDCDYFKLESDPGFILDLWIKRSESL